jgi:hypothetical protein
MAQSAPPADKAEVAVTTAHEVNDEICLTTTEMEMRLQQ